MEGVIVVSGASPPHTSTQKNISEEDVIILRFEATEESTDMPVIGTSPPPQTTTEPPFLSLQQSIGASDTTFEPTIIKTMTMNESALTQMSEMVHHTSALFTSCQCFIRESKPNPSLHLPLAPTAATAPSKAAQFHQAKAPHQQQTAKKDNLPTFVVDQNIATNPTVMTSESLYMNEFTSNIDGILDYELSEGASEGACVSAFNIEDPSLQTAFFPTERVAGDRGMRDILSSVESLDAVLDDEIINFIKG